MAILPHVFVIGGVSSGPWAINVFLNAWDRYAVEFFWAMICACVSALDFGIALWSLGAHSF